MKIIGGEIKNQPLKVPSHIRPASSRLKKGIFDIFGDELRGKSVLDLLDRKSTRLNSSHTDISRMPSSA